MSERKKENTSTRKKISSPFFMSEEGKRTLVRKKERRKGS